MRQCFCGFVIIISIVIAAVVAQSNYKIATFVETDIGQYMDDTWALATLLADDTLDVRAIILSTNNTLARARIVAKLITGSEYASKNIALVIGKQDNDYAGPQAAWADDFDLASYPGPIIKDVDAASYVTTQIKSALMERNTTAHVMLVEQAPPVVFGTIAAKHGQSILGSGRVLISEMGGSFYYGYGHQKGQANEYNLVHDVEATQNLLNNDNSVMPAENFVLSPLDTSSQVRIQDTRWTRFLQLYEKRSSFLVNVMESYRSWKKNCPLDPFGLMCFAADPDENSGNLFDAQTAAFAGSMVRSLTMKDEPMFNCVNKTILRIYADDKGLTQIDDKMTVQHAHDRTVALNWIDNDRFIELLLSRILKL